MEARAAAAGVTPKTFQRMRNNYWRRDGFHQEATAWLERQPELTQQRIKRAVRQRQTQRA